MSVRKRIQQLQQITTEDKACNFSDKVDVSITQKPEEEEKQNRRITIDDEDRSVVAVAN